MNIVSVKFLSDNKLADYKVDYKDGEKLFEVGEIVVIDTGQCKELAKIVKTYLDKSFDSKEEGNVLKVATEEEIDKNLENIFEAKKYLEECRRLVSKHNLQMRIIDARLSLDEKKITFYFSAEGRVDFRMLVLDCVKEFKKLIRLQQIGCREQAKKTGGYGKCGRCVCCNSFLENEAKPNMDMVKNQCIHESNTSKINGLCGKLMCCLEYEDENYTINRRELPRVDEIYKTKDGTGRIIKVNIIDKKIFVKLDKRDEVVEVKL